MATSQFTVEEAGAANVGCRHDHGKRAAALDAVQDFFTSPPANTNQTVLAQLRARLAVPLGFTPTVAQVEKAIYSLLEERR